MAYKNQKFTVKQNGKDLDKSLYSWDDEIFFTKENDLELDFTGYIGMEFRTGSNCKFKTGADCHFVTGSNCSFVTGPYCIFQTSFACNFETEFNCTFLIGSHCYFKTGSNCLFRFTSNTDSCTFLTGKNSYAYFKGTEFIIPVLKRCTYNTIEGFKIVDVETIESIIRQKYKCY